SAATLLPRLGRRSTAISPVHIAAAVSLETVLGQILADYASETVNFTVRTIFGASDELADLLLAGAPADLFLSADRAQMDRLVDGGLVEAGSRRAFAGNYLAAVAPVGRQLAVRRPINLLRPAIRRIVLAAPASPLGSYTRKYLERYELYEKLLPRVI